MTTYGAKWVNLHSKICLHTSVCCVHSKCLERQIFRNGGSRHFLKSLVDDNFSFNYLGFFGLSWFNAWLLQWDLLIRVWKKHGINMVEQNWKKCALGQMKKQKCSQWNVISDNFFFWQRFQTTSIIDEWHWDNIWERSAARGMPFTTSILDKWHRDKIYEKHW